MLRVDSLCENVEEVLTMNAAILKKFGVSHGSK